MQSRAPAAPMLRTNPSPACCSPATESLFRDLLTRESNAPRWRELLNILRRLEARGELRGGRFVNGFSGEQFALPQAVESLREARKHISTQEITVAGADPLNLAGIIVKGERVSAVPGKEVRYRNGAVLIDDTQIPEDAPPADGDVLPAARKHRFSIVSTAAPAKTATLAPTLF